MALRIRSEARRKELFTMSARLFTMHGGKRRGRGFRERHPGEPQCAAARRAGGSAGIFRRKKSAGLSVFLFE